MDEETLGIGYALASAIGFGTVGVVGTVAGDLGLSIPTVLGFRFAIATAVLWGVLAIRGRFRLLTGQTAARVLVLGIAGYAAMSGLYFWALEYLSAGLVVILLYTYPAFVVAATLASSPGQVSRPLLLALAFALGGVVLIVGAGPADADSRGVVIMLGAALAYAGYMLGSERLLRSIDAETLSAWVLPAAGLAFGCYGLSTGTIAVPESTAATAWLVLLALGLFGTAAPILALFAGLRRIGASRTSIVSTIEPGVAVVLGAAVLGEPVTIATVLGGVLVVSGVILIHRRG